MNLKIHLSQMHFKDMYWISLIGKIYSVIEHSKLFLMTLNAIFLISKTKISHNLIVCSGDLELHRIIVIKEHISRFLSLTEYGLNLQHNHTYLRWVASWSPNQLFHIPLFVKKNSCIIPYIPFCSLLVQKLHPDFFF